MLTDKQRECIVEWLGMNCYQRSANCPFGYGASLADSEICKSWFPKIEKCLFDSGTNMCGVEHMCPCDAYTSKYVYRKAKRCL